MNVTKVHEYAMDLSERADRLNKRGNRIAAQDTYAQAYSLEATIAAKVKEEPSRSVIHYSAACLAVECELYPFAARLLYAGLADNTPREIRAEMEQLLKEVEGHIR